MPRTIQIQQGADANDALSEVVEALKDGAVVGLPGTTGYCATALATNDAGMAKLGELLGGKQYPETFCLAVLDADQAQDCIGVAARPLQRLMQRCWPGPVVVRAKEENASAALGQARELISDGGFINLVSPADPIAHLVLRHVNAPLVVTGDGRGELTFKDPAELTARMPELDLILTGSDRAYDQPRSVVEVSAEGFEVVFSGAFGELALRRSACEITLFVCTGNTCRSPLAEGLFRKLLSDRLECDIDELPDRGHLVLSAGIAAAMGSPASPESVELLAERGVDGNGHASQPLTEQLLMSSDFVYTLTRGHREAILRFKPEFADRIQVLMRDGSDVADPIGRGMGEYQRCRDQIEMSLKQILDSNL